MEKRSAEVTFVVEIQNALTDFVIMHQSVSFGFRTYFFFRGAGCKQLQVKGQRIHYSTRKGNAYIIQSASVFHPEGTHSTPVSPCTLDYLDSRQITTCFEHISDPHHTLHCTQAVSYACLHTKKNSLHPETCEVRKWFI